MVSADAIGVESTGMPELVVDVDYEAALLAFALFEHEVKGEFSSEFDQTVVACFGDDENGLDVCAYACAAELLAHLANAYGSFSELFGETGAVICFVFAYLCGRRWWCRSLLVAIAEVLK